MAVHEIGHALGLEHSSKEKAIMNALYKGYNGYSDIQLDSDDIDGIKALYGKDFSGSRIIDCARWCLVNVELTFNFSF